MAKKKGAEYISGKESRAITKENRRVTDVIEKKRNRKHIPEAEYISKMKNPDNVVEFDDEHGGSPCCAMLCCAGPRRWFRVNRRLPKKGGIPAVRSRDASGERR